MRRPPRSISLAQKLLSVGTINQVVSVGCGMLPLSNFLGPVRHFRATLTAHVLKLGPGYATALFCSLSTSAEAA